MIRGGTWECGEVPKENANGISSSSEGLARSAYPGIMRVAQQPIGAGMLGESTSILPHQTCF
jgi:hypothetical protein